MTSPRLSGPQAATLWRLPPAYADFAPRPKFTHGITIAALMQAGLVERDPAGSGLYRRTAAGDAAAATTMPRVPVAPPLPLQGGGMR